MSHVTTSEIYFKIISATSNTLENIHELQSASEIII